MNKKYCMFNDKVFLIDSITNNKIIIRKDNVVVETSLDKVQILPDDFVPNKKKSSVNVNATRELIPNEIMLRHMTKEEAIYELDGFIDKALTCNIGRIRIIHGRHGGILRKAVHEYLASHPFVKEFSLAPYGEGNIGVTIALIGRKRST